MFDFISSLLASSLKTEAQSLQDFGQGQATRLLLPGPPGSQSALHRGPPCGHLVGGLQPREKTSRR